MKRTLGLTLLLLIIVGASVFPHLSPNNAVADDSYPVVNRSTGLTYLTIQSAIDAPLTSDGNIILVKKGTCTENITINKSIVLVGEDRDQTIIDGNQTRTVIRVIASGVLIQNVTVKNGITGIFVDHSNNTQIIGSNVVNCIPDKTMVFYEFQQGIRVQYSFNCVIRNSVIANNAVTGVLITDSSNFTVSSNQVYRNGNSSYSYGLNTNASSYGLIAYNNVYENKWDNIGLGYGSTNCTILGNNVTGYTVFGMWVDHGSDGNIFYGNNIVNNVIAAQPVNVLSQWDSGIEGNYWGNYFTANNTDTNYDGIGDSSYGIDINNTDRFPLMGRFHSFFTYKNQVVDVITNSGTDNFAFFRTNNTIKMHVSSMAPDQTEDFCRIRIPHSLMIEPYSVTVDGVEPSYVNYTVNDDETSRWIYFRYSHSMHEISISGAQPPDTIPPAISVLSPENVVYVQDAIPLIFVTDEETSWIGYSLDKLENTTISDNVTLSGLLDGLHEITVYANDTAGNTGSSEAIFFTVKAQTGLPTILWVSIAMLLIPALGGLAILAYKRLKKQNG